MGGVEQFNALNELNSDTEVEKMSPTLRKALEEMIREFVYAWDNDEVSINDVVRKLTSLIAKKEREALIKYQNYQTLRWNLRGLNGAKMGRKGYDQNREELDRLDIESVEQYLSEQEGVQT